MVTPHKETLMIRSILFIALASLSATACSKKDGGSGGNEAPKSTEAMKTAEPAAAPAPSAAATESVVDLSPGGEKWKGWAIKGPADAKVTDNGAGGVGIVFGSFSFEMTQGDLEIALSKDGLKSGLEFSKGKATFTVDKPDAIEYTTETPMEGGAPIKGYGFKYMVNAEAKIGCSALLDDEKQIAAAKAGCNSLHKK